MSFQTFPAKLTIHKRTIDPSTFAWVTRLVLPFIVFMFMLTSTGCSMVMGLFGPTDTAVVTDTESARILMPTPVREGASAIPTAPANGPTPTPFIMRPSTSAQPSTFIEPTAAPGDEAKPPTLYATILGDRVNMRNAPGLDTEIVATVALDTQFEYVDETREGDWVQICCVNDQLAWVYSELIRISTTPSSASAAISAPVAGEQVGQLQPVSAEAGGEPRRVAVAPTTRLQPQESALAFVQTQASQRFTSDKGNFSLVLPPAWLPLMEANGLIGESITAIERENPAVAALLEAQLSDMDDIPVAFIAFDLSPESLQSGFTTNVNILKQPVPAGFPLNYVVQLNADQLETVLGLSDAAEATDLILPAGESVMLDYQVGDQAKARQYYLLHDQALYIVTFTVATTLADAKLILFNEMMQSFQFLR